MCIPPSFSYVNTSHRTWLLHKVWRFSSHVCLIIKLMDIVLKYETFIRFNYVKPALNYILSEKYVILYVELFVLRSIHPNLIMLHTVKKNYYLYARCKSPIMTGSLTSPRFPLDFFSSLMWMLYWHSRLKSSFWLYDTSFVQTPS
jgi:hypothetical protein